MFSMYNSIMHHYYHIKFLFQDLMPFTGRLQNLALTSIPRLHFITSVGIKQLFYTSLGSTLLTKHGTSLPE